MLGLSIIIAYGLDLVLGDPPYRLHPVRIIGALAGFYERKLREFIPDETRAGTLLAVGLSMDVFFLVLFLLWLADWIHPLLVFALSTFFIYSAISVKCMADHALQVREALGAGDLPEARRRLSLIVGRDTTAMAVPEISRAAVETVAEGTVDGIISPLFYAALGGAPLAMVFKAVSTLDSMVGYRNEVYERFGRFSARFDDVLNYLPARISPVLVALGAVLSGESGPGALRIGFRDGHNNPSPNSGFPEAAFSGALKVRMGGRNFYQGVAVDKPVIGGEGNAAAAEDIGRAVRLMYFSSFFAFLLSLAIWYFIRCLLKGALS